MTNATTPAAKTPAAETPAAQVAAAGTATAAAETPAAAPPEFKPVEAKGIAPVKAVCRIDSVILPDTIFTPNSDDQRAELLALEAVEELSEAEAALAGAIAIPTYGKLTAANDAAKARRIKEAAEKDNANTFVQKSLAAAVAKALPGSDDF